MSLHEIYTDEDTKNLRDAIGKSIVRSTVVTVLNVEPGPWNLKDLAEVISTEAGRLLPKSSPITGYLGTVMINMLHSGELQQHDGFGGLEPGISFPRSEFIQSHMQTPK